MFNTLKYAKILEEVGFSREQAETSVGILVEIVEDKLATKQDLLVFKQELLQSFSLAIAQSEARMTVRMGTMLAASIAILTAIQKLT